MGEVYLAQDTSELARTVALKIVPLKSPKTKIGCNDSLRKLAPSQISIIQTFSLFTNSARAIRFRLFPLNTSTASLYENISPAVV